MARIEAKSKVLVWEKPDKSIMVTYFFVEPTPDLIASEIDKLQREQSAIYGSITPKVMNLSDLPDAKYKRKWRMKPNGEIKIDNTVETIQEAKDRKKTGVIAKLKGLGLNDEDLDVLINR